MNQIRRRDLARNLRARRRGLPKEVMMGLGRALPIRMLPALLMLASHTASAEPPSASPPAAVPIAAAPQFVTGHTEGMLFVKSSFLGKTVYAEDGAVIGDIDELVVEDGHVAAVIVGVGGFLGVGERKIGVRYDALSITRKDGVSHFVLPGVSKEQLAAVAPFAPVLPHKNILQKAGDVAKDAARKAGDVAKAGLDKAKEAVQGATGAPAESTVAPPAEAPSVKQ